MRGSARATLLAAGSLSLLIAGFALVLHSKTQPVAARAKDITSRVPLAQAAFARYVSRVTASGHVSVLSGGGAKLAFASSGIVAKIDVRVGDFVGTGDVLAELDRSGLTIDVAQTRSDALAAAAAYGNGNVPRSALNGAQARLTVARGRLLVAKTRTGIADSDHAAALAAERQSQAKLELDRPALDRQTALYLGGVTARKDLEAARETLTLDRAEAQANRATLTGSVSNIGAALAQARADVAQAASDLRAARAQLTISAAQAASAQARYDAAQRLLASGELRAPAAGVVTAILKHPGEAVDPTQAAISLAPKAPSEVTLMVSGSDAQRVRPGDRVAMQDIDRGGKSSARVRAILPGVDSTTQTTTVLVDGAPASAAAGDAIEAVIVVAERRGIVIPTSAIVEDPQSGLSIVFVRQRASDGTEKFVSREITVASGNDQNTLVERGLRDGERIASQGAFDLLAPSGGG